MFQQSFDGNRETTSRIVLGDSLTLLSSIASESVSLIITSPPYNLGKEYEIRTSIDAYLSSFESFLKQFHRVLSNDGSICWQVGNFVDNGEVFPLDILFYNIFKKEGFHLRNRIIWHFEHGLHASRRFSGRYETILWFTKTDKYTFNLDDVRIPSKYPGKKHYKGSKKGQYSGNPNGKNPSDFWQTLEKDWESLVWDIPNVKANHPEKTIHPCQFPIELVERCILALTNEGDTVLDPFAGVGSSAIAAAMHDRVGLGFDKEESYVDIANKRILQFYEGSLKVRPLGKPVYTPKSTDRIAQLPIEWQLQSDKKNEDKQ